MADVPTVLIIDTEEAVVETCERWLRDSYMVHRLNPDGDTEGAFDIAEIDVVLLGRAIRVISREEVFEAIRNRTADCRVVLMTDADSEFDILETIFDGRITKPLDEAELRDTIERLLDRATLDATLRQYYLQTLRQVTIRSDCSDGTLESDEEYAELVERTEQCRKTANEMMGDMMSDTAFVGAIREIMDYSRHTASSVSTR